MGSITLRVGDELEASLKAAARERGVSVSQVVREALGQGGPDTDRVDDLERRLSRLEEMAGL